MGSAGTCSDADRPPEALRPLSRLVGPGRDEDMGAAGVSGHDVPATTLRLRWPHLTP